MLGRTIVEDMDIGEVSIRGSKTTIQVFLRMSKPLGTIQVVRKITTPDAVMALLEKAVMDDLGFEIVARVLPHD